MLEFSYCNKSNRMVVLRCIGPSNFFFEKVLLPAEVLLFSAPEDSKLEVWGNGLYGPNLEERIRIKENYNQIAA